MDGSAKFLTRTFRKTTESINISHAAFGPTYHRQGRMGHAFKICIPSVWVATLAD